MIAAVGLCTGSIVGEKWVMKVGELTHGRKKGLTSFLQVAVIYPML